MAQAGHKRKGESVHAGLPAKRSALGLSFASEGSGVDAKDADLCGMSGAGVTLDILPDDVLMRIFADFLGPEDLCRSVEPVCKHWRELLRADRAFVWRRQCVALGVDPQTTLHAHQRHQARLLSELDASAGADADGDGDEGVGDRSAAMHTPCSVPVSQCLCAHRKRTSGMLGGAGDDGDDAEAGSGGQTCADGREAEREHALLRAAALQCVRWDIMGYTRMLDLHGHQKSVRSIVTVPEHDHVLTASSDCTLRVWDMHTGKCVCTLPHAQPLWVVRVVHGHVLVGDARGVLHVYAVGSYAKRGEVKAHHAQLFVIEEHAGTLYTGGDDGVIRLWTVCSESGVVVPTGGTLDGHAAWITTICFDAEHNLAFTGGGYGDCSVRVHDLATRKCVRSVVLPNLSPHMSYRGNHTLVAGLLGGEVVTLDTRTMAILDKQRVQNGWCMFAHACSSHVLTGGDCGTLNMRRQQREGSMSTLQVWANDWVRTAHISADHRVVCCGSRGGVVRCFLWD